MGVELENVGREFIISHRKGKGYRAISWAPHFILTRRRRRKEDAIADGDKEVKKYYDGLAEPNKQKKHWWTKETES